MRSARNPVTNLNRPMSKTDASRSEWRTGRPLTTRHLQEHDMQRRLLPLNALRAFAAVHETGGIRSAVRALSVILCQPDRQSSLPVPGKAGRPSAPASRGPHRARRLSNMTLHRAMASRARHVRRSAAASLRSLPHVPLHRLAGPVSPNGKPDAGGFVNLFGGFLEHARSVSDSVCAPIHFEQDPFPAITFRGWDGIARWRDISVNT